MFKQLIIGAGVVIAVASLPAVALHATTDNSENNKNSENHKVTLCHATNSVKNPYVKITVSVSAAGNFKDNGNGDHAHHTGPIATSQKVAEDLKKAKTHWGDIIPAGEYNTSLNWTREGRAVFENDCNFPKHAPVKTVKVEQPVNGSEAEVKTPVEETVTELPRTGGSSRLLAVIASVSAYIATRFGGNVKALYRRSI